MVNILITGGAGFIGSSLANKLLLNKTYRIIVVDNLETGFLSNLKIKKENFYKIDVNNYKSLSKVFAKYKFDYVFHFAALVGVERTQKNPLKVLKDIRGFENIFNLSSDYNIKTIFFSSSSEVYGEPVTIPQNEETTPLNSRIPYAIVKNLGESFCKTFYKEKKLKYTIFRFFNTYGKKQSDDFVISRFLNLAKKNKLIKVYGDGNQKRTFCYIDDTIDTIIRCFEKKLHVNDILNVGSNKEVTLNFLAKLIIKILNSKSKITHIKPLKEGDMKRRRPDNKKMQKILNRKLINITQGLRKII